MSLSLLTSLNKELSLDLTGLTVYTEAASGSYMNSPILIALAGAKHIYAQAKTTRYGSAHDIIQETHLRAQKYGVADRITLFEGRNLDFLAKADIVTNTGMIRPIDQELIDSLKPTAVIPLMWETWEHRDSDFDLPACKQKGILSLGTIEHKAPCDMLPYTGLVGLKLLFELGFDGGEVLVLGNTHFPGESMVKQLRGAQIKTTWFSDSPTSDYHYDQLARYFSQNGHSYSHLIVNDMSNRETLLGSDGYLDFTTIQHINPDIKIGISCGTVLADEIKASGLEYFPSHIAEPGFMSYQAYSLGPRPVLHLFAAGIKVGQEMARARLNGLSVEKAARHALEHSPAQDFPDQKSWFA